MTIFRSGLHNRRYENFRSNLPLDSCWIFVFAYSSNLMIQQQVLMKRRQSSKVPTPKVIIVSESHPNQFMLQILCFWTLPIVLFLLKQTTFRRLWFCLRLHVEPTQLGSVDKARPYLSLDGGLALYFGPNWIGSTWRRRQNPVSETLCF
jgi:hypothetical protein